ncbi:MAG: hypothetical protein Kow0025_11540 [Thermodesulfovibrionales bacterium]
MHTDEYEISLLREIEVCEKAIRKARKSLQKLEEKHGMTTEAFAERYARGLLPAGNRDFASWLEGREALRGWEERKAGFEAVYRRMKV